MLLPSFLITRKLYDLGIILKWFNKNTNIGCIVIYVRYMRNSPTTGSVDQK